MSRSALSVAIPAVLLSALFLNGCGAGNKEGGAVTAARLNNDTMCIQCHGSRNFDPITGVDKVVQYLATSPHNETGLGCESCHGGGAQHNGVGPIPFPLAGLTDTQKAARCAQCHDGVTPLSFKFNNLTTVVPRATNAADFFAVSKHATQQGHFGNGCQSCHTHEGAVLANVLGIRGDDTIVRTGPAGSVNAQALTDALAAFPNVTAGFQCSTCHEHGGGLRPIQARFSSSLGRNSGAVTVWNPANTPNGVPKNNQFNLCTSCHYMYNYNSTRMIASGTTVSNTLPFPDHAASQTRVFTITHKEKGMNGKINIPFANMTAAADGTNTRLTGWVIRLNAPSGGVTQADPNKNYATDPYYNGPCFDCHDHEFRTNSGNKPVAGNRTIWSDWGQSAHAGRTLAAKYVDNGADKVTFPTITDYRMQAYADDAFAGGTNAFSHYNWDSTLKADGTDDRGPCQKCHTATGISNYLNGPTTYDPIRNDFSHLIGWTQKTPAASASGGSRRQNEVLYCWGCHRNAASGILRNPGAVTTAEYTYNGAAVTFPDVGSSNVCVVCHTGRGNNDTIRNTPVASRSASRNPAHHASTGATLFAAQSHVAYEYTGKNYLNPAFRHSSIGVSDGTGPCASCHMGDSENYGRASHTFLAISSSTAGVPGKIYNQSLCDGCHTGSGVDPMPVATLASEKVNAYNAAQLLTDIIANIVQNHNNVAMNTNAFVQNPTTSLDDYGAVQNSLYFGDAGSDPGAYVHNRMYIKRIIFDSIDQALNGSLTGSITIPLTYPGAIAWFNANQTTGAATRP